MKTTTKKTLIVIAVLAMATTFPIGETHSFTISLLTASMAFFFGFIMTILAPIHSLRNHITINKPKWSDRFDDKQPLTYMFTIGILLLAIGIGGIIGGLLNGQVINFIAAVLFSAGVGVFMGIYFTLVKFPFEQKNNNQHQPPKL